MGPAEARAAVLHTAICPSSVAAAYRLPHGEVAWPRMVVYSGMERAVRTTIL